MSAGNQNPSGVPQSSSAGSPPSFPLPQPHDERVVIHPYPKIIFYFPTIVTAFICGILASIFPDDVKTLEVIAAVFMVVFFLNTIIVAFEFPRMTAVAFILLLVSITFGLLLLNQYFDLL